MNRTQKVTLVVLLVLLIDQASKFYIKTHFCYNQEVPIFGLDWARLHFVENEGMAFGITFDWQYGKLLLSLFRILMVLGLIWYIRLLLQARVSMGFVYSVGLITAGALGNIIDSAFYGLIFTESPVHDCVPAQVVDIGQGYGTFLHGRVVDMLYFPITWINLPGWVPVVGGEQYLFFSPIFNIADTAITTGVLAILLFQRRFFRESFDEGKAKVAAQEKAIEEGLVETEEPGVQATVRTELAHTADSPAIETENERRSEVTTGINPHDEPDLGSLAEDTNDNIPGEQAPKNPAG